MEPFDVYLALELLAGWFALEPFDAPAPAKEGLAQRGRQSVRVCVCERERVCERVSEGDSRVRVCESERESVVRVRERVCVSV